MKKLMLRSVAGGKHNRDRENTTASIMSYLLVLGSIEPTHTNVIAETARQPSTDILLVFSIPFCKAAKN